MWYQKAAGLLRDAGADEQLTMVLWVSMNGRRSKLEANLEVGSSGRGVDSFGASGRQGNDLETFGPFPAKLAPPKFNFTNALSGVQDSSQQ
jgi:hypothetical protein